MERLYYTVGEVADLLGVKERRAQQLLQAGIIPQIRPGHKYLIPRQAFAAWIMGQNAEALSNAGQSRGDSHER